MNTKHCSYIVNFVQCVSLTVSGHMYLVQKMCVFVSVCLYPYINCLVSQCLQGPKGDIGPKGAVGEKGDIVSIPVETESQLKSLMHNETQATVFEGMIPHRLDV